MKHSSTLSTETIARAFDVLIDQCLQLRENENLVVIKDEGLGPYVRVLVERVVEKKIALTILEFPIAQQEMLAKQIRSDENGEIDWIPRPFGAAIIEASAIINAVSGSLRTTEVRRAILGKPRQHGCRLAHIPGLTDDILHVLGKSNIGAIFDDSELAAWALGEAKQATVVTRDDLGKTYKLSFAVGGWANEPQMSPGVILPGSWGNCPPGETFCCPNPDTVSGSICISGSVPGWVLAPEQGIVLTFEGGRLVNWASPIASPACEFFANQQQTARSNNDPNWNVFAEFGIGLNPAIAALTGNPLFDEKAAQTVHIAIGDNSGFGHSVKSATHSDLVAWYPDVYFDDHPIMRKGILLRDSIKDRRTNWYPAPLSINDHLPIRVLESEVEEKDKTLHRRLCRKDRVGLVRMVVDDEMGYALSLLKRAFAERHDWTFADLKRQHPSIGGHSCEYLLSVLNHYRCIVVG